MRGHGTILVVLSTLVLPGALALGEPGTDAAITGELVWLAPSFGYADHPVHAAIGVYDGDTLLPHQNLAVTALLDDEILFTTDFVHEHDGFHTLVVTPPRPGTLTLIAGANPSASEAPDERTHRGGIPVEIPILMGAGHPGTGEETVRVHPHFREADAQNAVLGANAHVPHQAFVDVRDPAGRLLLSYAPWANGWYTSHVAAPPGGFGDARIDALFTPYPLVNLTLFTERVSLEVDTPRGGIIRHSYPYPWTDDPTSCAQAGVPLVADPSSSMDTGHVWQTGTDVRFALATPAYLGQTTTWIASNVHSEVPRPSAYRILTSSPTGPVDGHAGAFAEFWAGDPFREVTLRLREAGHYVMTVETNMFEDGPACSFEFTILPNTDNDPGTVDHAIKVRNDTARIQFLAKRDGAALAHYEFDTRVVKLHTEDTPGRLVWKGKLHGHNGYAMFELGGLDPGDYEVRTYPSPQEWGTPPVAAPTGDGFVYRFHVNGSAPAPAAEDADPQRASVPGPGALLLGAVAGLAVLIRRRT